MLGLTVWPFSRILVTKFLFEISGSLCPYYFVWSYFKKNTFGHFARVLIDINLIVQLHDQLLVEREDMLFLSSWNMNVCLCYANLVIVNANLASMEICLITSPKRMRCFQKKNKWRRFRKNMTIHHLLCVTFLRLIRGNPLSWIILWSLF